MSTVLSIPFRILPSGSCATVDDGSSEADAEAVAALARTIRGEYPMLEDYGVTDPAWSSIDAAQLQAGIDTYGPAGLVITSVEATPSDDGLTDRVRITFTDGDDPSTGGTRG